MREAQRARLRLMARIVLVSTVFGAAIGPVVGEGSGASYVLPSILQGALTGAAISAWCSLYDLVLTRIPELRLHRLPFSLHVMLKTAWFAVGIVGMMVLVGMAFATYYGASGPFLPDYLGWMTVVSLLVAFAISLTLSIRGLLGPGVLASFVTGRYHTPREETRIFLFADLVGSTHVAEAIGPLRFLELLNDFVADVTEAVLTTRGEIYAYVGDEVIITWPLQAGLVDARCLACQFAIRDQIAARAAHYRRAYGLVPDFRAALHCGPVVAGELGADKQAIVFLGDTVNTTARLEQACRDLNEPFLVSGEMLDRLALPPAYVVSALGSRVLRGKSEPTAISAVRRLGDDLEAQPEAAV